MEKKKEQIIEGRGEYWAHAEVPDLLILLVLLPVGPDCCHLLHRVFHKGTVEEPEEVVDGGGIPHLLQQPLQELHMEEQGDP